MKKLFNLSAIVAVAMAAIIALSSFSSSDVEQFVGKLNGIAEQMKSVKTYEELMAINGSTEAEIAQFAESTAPLNDPDYSAIAKALYDISASMSAVAGTPSIPPFSDVEPALVQNLKKYKTLGELVSGM